MNTFNDILHQFIGTVPIQYDFIYAIGLLFFIVLFVLMCFSPFIILYKWVK